MGCHGHTGGYDVVGDSPSIWIELSGLEYAVRNVEAAGWQVRCLEAGDGHGHTMVLMHGTGGHLEAYARNFGALADGFQVLAYDYPGHGYSTHATRDLELDDYLDHLLDLLDVMGVGRAILNGESLGGWIAVKFAARHPDRVYGLILNTPGGTMARPEVMERIRTLSQQAAEDPTHERVRARLEWLMADPMSVTDELVEVRRRIYRRPGFAGSMQHILCLQDPTIRARNLVTDDELAAVECPTLVLWTSDDPSGPAAAGREMAAKIPGASFAFIEDAGHWPQWEQPDKFNELVVDFASDIGSDGG